MGSKYRTFETSEFWTIQTPKFEWSNRGLGSTKLEICWVPFKKTKTSSFKIIQFKKSRLFDQISDHGSNTKPNIQQMDKLLPLENRTCPVFGSLMN